MLRFDPIASHGPQQHLPDVRHSQILLGAVALLLALLALAAAAPDLGLPTLSLGGEAGSTGAAPASLGGVDSATPSWVSDPLRPPVEHLATAR